MQNAIQLLMDEHRLIERVLHALNGYAQAVASGEGFERADLEGFVSFIHDYADEKHHAKEEKILFTTMHDHGFPREAGPIAVMLHEHDLGRALVATLREAAAGDGEWSEADRKQVASAARQFTQLLQQHIDKEDNFLYPMATQAIPDAVFETVSQRCDAVEQELAAGGATARLEALATDLIGRYGG